MCFDLAPIIKLGEYITKYLSFNCLKIRNISSHK